MREIERTLLMRYICNYRTKLERDVQQYSTNVRYRSIDTLDCLELLLAIERLNAFREITKDILLILDLKKYTETKENLI